jgi:release factor glutamine methyltransferase
MTTGEAYNHVSGKLAQLYDEREAASIADWVLESVTGLKRPERRIHGADELEVAAELRVGSHLRELLLHKPVQYVLGEAWFYKMKFFVNDQVLIPRPETEELVSWAVQDVSNTTAVGLPPGELRLLDIGTGSGCIAIAVSKELPVALVTAIDVSEQALSVAQKNADDLQVPVEFLQVDFLDETHWQRLQKYDVIISNPPYIPEIEKAKLPQNVSSYEPGIALFVQNDDPFIFYKKIAKFAQSHLKPGGIVYVEINEDYAAQTARVFNGYNFKTDIKEDMYGKKRMIKARRDD